MNCGICKISPWMWSFLCAVLLGCSGFILAHYYDDHEFITVQKSTIPVLRMDIDNLGVKVGTLEGRMSGVEGQLMCIREDLKEIKTAVGCPNKDTNIVKK